MTIEELKELQSKIIKKNNTCNKICFSILITIMIITNIIILTIIKSPGIIMFCICTSMFELIFGIVIISIIKSAINGKDLNIYDREYKKIFVLKTLQNTFENLTYNVNEGLNEHVIEETRMMRTGDRFSSNDYISGTYKNIKFEQSDMHIEEKHETRDKDGNKEVTWITIFEGRWMIFDFNKKFRSNIQVVSRNFTGESFFWNANKVDMEDVEFNKMFSIRTENEHDAFYILTPHFMEKIKEIYQELNCGIMFCFIDNKLHVAIDNRDDSFECNPYKVINEAEITTEISKDIELITSFVDDLDLDNNLFNNKY